MRTIKYVKDDDKKIRKAQETMEIYAPLADRMGMNRIRDELEDLSFEVLNNEARTLIKNRLDEIKYNNLINFNSLSEEFKIILNKAYKMLKFLEEKKHLFLFGEKYKKRTSLEQITDIIGFRVIVDRCN